MRRELFNIAAYCSGFLFWFSQAGGRFTVCLVGFGSKFKTLKKVVDAAKSWELTDCDENKVAVK